MENNRDLKSILNLMDSITPPPPEGKEDWIYKDIRWLTKEFQDKLFNEIIGNGNYLVLAISTRTFKDSGDERFFGGQYFISPQGMENIEEYNKSNK